MVRATAVIALFMASVGAFVAGCGDVPVDQDTANAVRRQRDTIVLPADTVIITRDSIVVRRDTIVVDRRDTITVLDTVLIERRPVGWSGSIRLVNPPLETEIAVDTVASSLKVYLERGTPTRIDLVLISRVPERPTPPPYKTPSWIHLSVAGYDLSTAASLPLTSDPTRAAVTNGMGVLFRSSDSEPVRWFATTGLGTGTFTVQSVDLPTRTIRANVAATFYSQGASTPTVVIDTLNVIMTY